MKPCYHSFWFAGSLFLFWLTTTSPTPAQIVPDTTLPTPSIVTPPNANLSIITGGTQVGSNLFHSFREFSIPTGGEAYFNNVSEIQNIISRVTGGLISNIDGSIRANGTANLFLINPNGIIFGPKASLNIGGSMLASTASSLIFPGGIQFSATTPQATPLLTVSVPIGLQFGPKTGNIQNQSQAIDDDENVVGLQVQPGKTLALLGGNVSIDGGTVSAPGGRVELGGVAEAGTVGLFVDGDTLRLSFPDSLARADVSLSNGAFVDASGEGGGDIQVQGRHVTLTDGSQIVATTQGAKPGGTLLVRASDSLELSGTSADGEFPSGLFSTVDPMATGAGGNVTLDTARLIVGNGAQVQVSTEGIGAAGNLAVRASDSVELIGSAANGTYRSGLFARVEEKATGTGGNLTIDTRKLIVRDGAQVSTSTLGQGQGGNLTVRATDLVEVSGLSADRKIGSRLLATVQPGATGDGGNLTIETGKLLVRDGAQVSTDTFGQGNAGDLTVRTPDVEVLGYGILDDGSVFQSSLLASAREGATGTGGNLTIKANRLSVKDGAQVSVTTFSEFSQARAGNLTVRASDVELAGVAISPNGQILTNDRGLSFPSGLFAGTDPGSTAPGGTLRIETDRLRLRDGAIAQTSTLGAGDAGDLIIQASKSVELVGNLTDNRYPTNLQAVSGGIPGVPGFVEATGKGGNLTVQTGELIVRDGALVAVSSLNPTSAAKGAGNLEITAQTIRLDNKGQLTAATASGNGGNISLNVQDLLLLRRNSEISTTAGIAGAGGNGGNITIDAKNGFIVAIPSENSDITANAFTGNGGNVQITAQSVFGTQYQKVQTPQSDITASSRFGLDGAVVINTPDVDPSRGLTALPTDVVDASGLIASGCGTPGRVAKSAFIVTGRGGLPENPSTPLSSDRVWEDMRPVVQQAQNPSSRAVDTQATTPTKAQMVEAQGWVINRDGKVVLIAQAPTVTASCQRVRGITP
jgi:filamentous hemagglutinin family protein